MSDWNEIHEAEGIEPTQRSDVSLSTEGVRAMQGQSELGKTDSAPPQDDIPNPSQKGSDFETWAENEVFHGEARRLVVHPEDNLHLNGFGDGVGITKDRRISDAYVDADGSIWELKSGYEKGGIDQDQLYEYSLMEQAGHVYIRDGGSIEKIPVKSINYLFETKTGAEANASHLKGIATPWYKDENGKVQLLDS
jgi:hypothetical protein